mgnify:CR=1 FL=1
MIDLTVCPSEFMEKEISRNDDINGRTVTMYNFIDEIKPLGAECENYVFGKEIFREIFPYVVGGYSICCSNPAMQSD